MGTEKRHLHYSTLANFLKLSVLERFKKMAKDDVLFRFLSTDRDPAHLVDISLQTERAILDLSEAALVSISASSALENSLKGIAENAQRALQDFYGKDVSKLFSENEVIEARKKLSDAKYLFLRKWMSISESASSIFDLAHKAFREEEDFQSHLEEIWKFQQYYMEAVAQRTPSLYRFLMLKLMDYELKADQEFWRDFASEAFHKPRALP